MHITSRIFHAKRNTSERETLHSDALAIVAEHLPTSQDVVHLRKCNKALYTHPGIEKQQYLKLISETTNMNKPKRGRFRKYPGYIDATTVFSKLESSLNIHVLSKDQVGCNSRNPGVVGKSVLQNLIPYLVVPGASARTIPTHLVKLLETMSQQNRDDVQRVMQHVEFRKKVATAKNFSKGSLELVLPFIADTAKNERERNVIFSVIKHRGCLDPTSPLLFANKIEENKIDGFINTLCQLEESVRMLGISRVLDVEATDVVNMRAAVARVSAA